ncbi:hypothetical protein Pmani_013462 [Petrolisthes manimaculis]|uniref:Uncharacterized protein n=1 Tax=Petrolisthes manimaculis TaxID=1843537 RepID=A0AAE1UDL2_9EUCA|nr:hypothetical protein Pmani_013462 [Petrolisthes manimaculis]
MTCRLGDGTGSLPAPAQALTLAGDIFYMMAKHWQDIPTHVDAYNTVCDIHQEMLTLLDNIIPAQGKIWCGVNYCMFPIIYVFPIYGRMLPKEIW